MAGLRAMMVAVSPEGVIGLGGKIPWRYPADLKRLKRLTLGATVIMGRLTWESMGSKPLPGRRNFVITSSKLPELPGGDVSSFKDIASALAHVELTGDGPVWFLGGAKIYAEAMRYCDLIDVTYVPDPIDDPAAVRFPAIDLADWEEGPLLEHEDDPRLTRRVFTRRRG